MKWNVNCKPKFSKLIRQLGAVSKHACCAVLKLGDTKCMQGSGIQGHPGWIGMWCQPAETEIATCESNKAQWIVDNCKHGT